MQHHWQVRVYYEDTDMGGVVYYANYFRFIERARSEWLRSLGVDQTELKGQGITFVVRRIAADYLAPARFDDALDILTEIHSATGARLSLEQSIFRGEVRLFTATVELAAMGPSGRPVRLPTGLVTTA